MYTKGEWKVERPLRLTKDCWDDQHTAVKSGDNIVCLLPEPHYIPDCGDREWYNGCVKVMKANANLIAAAPDLYLVCKAIQEYVKLSDEINYRLDQAIAKAEGK